MMYCHVVSDTVEIGPIALPRSWKNISGLDMLSDSDLEVFGWYPVTQPALDESFQTYSNIVFADGVASMTVVDTSLENAISFRLTQIEQHAAGLVNSIVEDAAPVKMASWPFKEAEALAYLASNDEADAEKLLIEANYRNITLDALVTIVMAKSELYRTQESIISGRRGKHRDAVKLLASVSDVLEYDYTVNWS